MRKDTSVSLYPTFKYCIMAKGKKTGGRQKGTPNKENPLKGYLRAHSLAYLEPRVQTDPITGGAREIQRQRLVYDGETGNVCKVIDLIPLTDYKSGQPLNISDFEADMIALSPNERVNAELRLLEFHTPKMKAVEVDMDMRATTITIEDRLRELCGEDDEDDED